MVTLTVTDQNDCENTYTDTVCVFPPLEADFESSRVCLGDTTLFTSWYAPADDSITSFSFFYTSE